MRTRPTATCGWKKVDAETGDTLPGARVQIKHIETGSIYTEVTNEAGVAIFDELKPGPYELMELEAPDGWIKDGQTYTVNVPAQDTVTFTLKNFGQAGPAHHQIRPADP